MRRLIGLTMAGLACSCYQPVETNVQAVPIPIESVDNDDDDLEPRCEMLESWDRDICARFAAHPRPSPALINRVEGALANETCVRGLDRWQRNYSYETIRERGQETRIDETRIAIFLRQSGRYGWTGGIRINSPNAGIGVDDRDYDLVLGSFDLRSNRLTLKFCGPNLVGGSGG